MTTEPSLTSVDLWSYWKWIIYQYELALFLPGTKLTVLVHSKGFNILWSAPVFTKANCHGTHRIHHYISSLGGQWTLLASWMGFVRADTVHLLCRHWSITQSRHPIRDDDGQSRSMLRSGSRLIHKRKVIVGFPRGPGESETDSTCFSTCGARKSRVGWFGEGGYWCHGGQLWVMGKQSLLAMWTQKFEKSTWRS